MSIYRGGTWILARLCTLAKTRQDKQQADQVSVSYKAVVAWHCSAGNPRLQMQVILEDQALKAIFAGFRKIMLRCCKPKWESCSHHSQESGHCNWNRLSLREVQRGKSDFRWLTGLHGPQYSSEVSGQIEALASVQAQKPTGESQSSSSWPAPSAASLAYRSARESNYFLLCINEDDSQSRA